MSAISIDEQIACVKREIGYRERVYPRWVAAGKLPQIKANAEIERMRAVLATLANLDGLIQEFASAAFKEQCAAAAKQIAADTWERVKDDGAHRP